MLEKNRVGLEGGVYKDPPILACIVFFAQTCVVFLSMGSVHFSQTDSWTFFSRKTIQFVGISEVSISH